MLLHRSVFIVACLVPGACVMSNPSWDPPSADAGTEGDDPLATGDLDSAGELPTGAGDGDGDPTGGQDGGSSGDGDGDPTGGQDGGEPGSGDGDGDWGDDSDGDDWGGDGDGRICGEASPSFGPCPPSCDECHDGVCWRTCSAGECHDDLIVCPVAWSCRVRCIGKDSCKEATLACAGWGSCDIECEGESACASADVLCAAGPCSVTCAGDADHKPCDHLDVKCGSDSTELRCEEPFEGAGPVLSQNKFNECGCDSDCESEH